MPVCDVVFAFMPYSWLEYPSLALGLFKTECEAAGIASRVLYSNHRFAEFAGIEAFERFDKAGQMFAISWESLFTEAAGFTPRLAMEAMVNASAADLRAYYEACGTEPEPGSDAAEFMEAWHALYDRVDAFIEQEADTILAMRPKVVACSVLTQQRNASFALFRRIKQKAPEVITLLGGGECTLEAAEAYLKAVPSLDYVFAGEGDGVMADLLGLLVAGKRAEAEKKHPYLIYKGRTDGVYRSLPDISNIAVPDYSEYIETVQNEAFGQRFSHFLLLEGSRGCWWGEKNRCRFCAMHVCKEVLHFRAKKAERLFGELEQFSREPFWDCVNLSDCILDYAFIRDLPDTPPRSVDWHIYAEIKSNLRPEDMLKLRFRGFYAYQPGIEALQDDLLRLMHKGATAIQQVQLLKFARQYGIHLQWNLMHTFPGDKREWYEQTIALMPLLHHLQPPANAIQMLLMRHSPYLAEPEKYGLTDLRPHTAYDAVDPADREFTAHTASLFSSPALLAELETVAALRRALEQWRRAYYGGAFLARRVTEEGLYVHDTRRIRKEEHYTLTGVRRAVAEACTTAVSRKSLYRTLAADYTPDEIDAAIGYLLDRLLCVELSGRVLFLALPKCLPYKKGRMRHGCSG